ncbi:MAG: hypothetical protein ACC682_04280 [Gemmatimonadota bacterium]
MGRESWGAVMMLARGRWTDSAAGRLVRAASLAVLTLFPGTLLAQGLELGGGLTRMTNPPPALFEPGNDCPPSQSWAGEGRIAFRFSRVVSIEGTGGYNWASSDFCVLPPAAIPPSGPHSVSARTTPGGFPFFTSDARLAFEPSSPSGPMWLRVFGGYGVMWGKDTRYWLAGGGLVLGQEIQTVIEAEWNWFDLPYDQTTLNYQDGALVSTEKTSGSTSHNTFRLRAGFRWSP